MPKTPADYLVDAEEIIRQKDSEIRARDQQIRRLQHEEDTAAKIRREIFNIAEHTPEPPAWLSGRGGKAGARGAPTCILSDIHYGETIFKDQVGGYNEYNPAVARKRVMKWADKVVDLALNHMGRGQEKYPGLICMFGGDMIGGDIHEELAWTNAKTTIQSVNEVTDLLAGAIDNLATSFGKIFIPAVVGNHGRTTKKRHNKNMVFTNYDWGIYCNLERYFKDNKHIQFMIPHEADARFNVFGHRYLLTHGDTLGVKGGDGIIGSIGPIIRGSLKVHRSSAQIGKDFDTIVMAHWHQYISLKRIIVNNAVKGFDEYAHLQLRADPSVASQALWFTHPEHGITARWEVYLEKERVFADHRKWVEFPQAA